MIIVLYADCTTQRITVHNGHHETFATSLPCAVKNCSHRPAESEPSVDYDTQLAMAHMAEIKAN